MFHRRILPSSVRRSLRLFFDSFFCRKNIGLARIGDSSSWWISPALLKPESKVLSGGAGKDISFEYTLINRFGCQIALFDPSPTGIATFHKTAEVMPVGNKLRYFPIGLAGVSQQMTFAKPLDPTEGSFTVASDNATDVVEFECLSPVDAIDQTSFERIDLLKLDIEGFEYGFLNALLATKHRPAQIAVEFHDFFPNVSFRRTWSMICSLHRAGYRIAHKKQYDYLFILNSVLPGLSG